MSRPSEMTPYREEEVDRWYQDRGPSYLWIFSHAASTLCLEISSDIPHLFLTWLILLHHLNFSLQITRQRRLGPLAELG